jgi:hypothetical protein
MGLVRAGAWAAATAAAVSVAWLGVHRVLGDTSYEQPRMLAAAPGSGASSAPPLPTPIASPTRTAPQTGPQTASGTPTPPQSAGPGSPSSPSDNGTGAQNSTVGSSSSGQIVGYNRPGGRVVVDMGASSASVVTAIADSGWSVHQWSGDDWLRVDFMQGSTDSIFYVTWNGHTPSVMTWLRD